MHYVFLSTGSWERNASMIRARELGRHLIARGVTVSYAVDATEYNRAHLDLDPAANVAFTTTLTGPAQIPARRRTLKGLRPDFVHVINPAPKTCATLWGSRHRLVADWDEWPAMRPYRGTLKWMIRYLDGWFRNRAALNVVASTYMRDQFRARYNVDAAYIPYATYITDQPETSSPFTHPTAVYMGFLGPDYDHDLIFHAARLLAAAGKHPPITFIGGGPDVDRWRAFVAENNLPNVTVKGYVSDEERWRHLRHAHVLLFPMRPSVTNLARCPAKTYAYAQARRPVLTNRTGEIPHVLGDHATYLDLTAEAFATAIDRALATDLPDVDYHIEQHNWSARAEALLQALPH